MYIIGSLANIAGIEKITKFLIEKNFLVNDSWISHGPEPDIYYHRYVRNKWKKCRALKTPIMQSIFSLDAKFIEDADIVINVQPSGKSSCVEAGMAFRAAKFTLLLINDDEDYDKIEVMYNCYTMIQSLDHFLESGWEEIREKFNDDYHIDYYNEVYDSCFNDSIYQ